MTWALTLSALLMGLAGSWHCAVMCGATSAAVQRACSRGGRSAPAWWGFQLGRLLGYALAGAAVAASVAVLAQIGQWSPVLRPIWALAHAAALSLGLWLLW
ncbi:MAG TPA: sulfite exporter TauE/SafE family protein, partial [Ideonella sp.]|nr:sulfite exporter TauE/SafE family protein [Ideonella sp.]